MKRWYNMKLSHGSRLSPLTCICLLLVAAILFGCARLSPSQTKVFQNSVNAADIGMQTQLDLISAQITEGQGERVLTKRPPALLETDFPSVLSPSTKLGLLNQLGVMRDYAEILRRLTDGEYRGQLTDALSKFNAQINGSIDTVNGLKEGNLASDARIAEIKEQLGILSSIAAAIGEITTDVYAQRKAREVVKRYDPTIQDFCKSLQVLIHPDPDFTQKAGAVGLVTLTQSAYLQSRTAFAQRFETNKPPVGDDPDKVRAFQQEQRRLMTLYRQNIEGERMSLTALSGLRVAIGKIADAHSALAKDQEADFWAAVNQAADYLELVTMALKLEQIKQAK